MKKIIYFLIVFTVAFQILIACNFGYKTTQTKSQVDSSYFIIADTLLNGKNLKITTSQDSLFITVDNKQTRFFWGAKRQLPKQILTGLTFIKDRKIIRREVFLKDDILLFTFFDELYRQELFIFNTKNNRLIEDKIAHYPSLLSDFDPFIVDEESNRIVEISKGYGSADDEILRRDVSIYRFDETKRTYEGSFTITGIDELIDSDYIEILGQSGKMKVR